jgi:hypothetical protein
VIGPPDDDGEIDGAGSVALACVVYRHSGVIGMLCKKRKQPEATAICRVPYIHVRCPCFCWHEAQPESRPESESESEPESESESEPESESESEPELESESESEPNPNPNPLVFFICAWVFVFFCSIVVGWINCRS